MLPKLSLVSVGAHQKVLDWVIKYRPVSIIIVNERGQSRPERPWENNEIDAIRKAMGASPKTLWIFRSWPDGIGEAEEDIPLPDRVGICFEPFMDMPNPKMGHSYNEPGFPWIRTSGDARKLAMLETVFARTVHHYGLLSMNFCFSESHILKGNLGLWEIYAEALPCVDALGFNEYDWPWVFTSRDQGYKWRLGHWEHQWDRISKFLACDDIPPIIIGEGILDGKIETPDKPTGWQKRWKPEKYIEMHEAVHYDTYGKRQVFAHHTFCYCHPSSEWRSYSVEPILDQLGQLVQGQVYWEDYILGHPSPDVPNDPGGDMGEEIIKAIDVSEWGGEIKESQWKIAYDAGFRMAIVQAWGGGPIPGGKNTYCERQLAGARKAGMMTAIYIVIPPDDTTLTHLLIQAAKDAAGSEYQYVKFVAMDIESDKDVQLHPTDPKGRLANAIANVKDKPVVIYTSRYMWPKLMGGNISDFKDYPLWDARYDKVAELDTNWVSYGGWAQRALKQYQGTTMAAGVISADLNVADLRRLSMAEPPQPQECPMCKEKDAIIAKKNNVIRAARNTLDAGLEP